MEEGPSKENNVARERDQCAVFIFIFMKKRLSWSEKSGVKSNRKEAEARRVEKI